MVATLRIKPAPEAGPGARLFEVDCEHGTTQGWLIPGALPIERAAFITYLLERHQAEEGCRCTRKLRLRYGLIGRDQ
jgi:hypothetical protein